MIYEKYPELKYKYRNREFWCRGYYVDTVGKNAKKIEEYIKHQLDEDKAGEQLTMGNFWVSWARLRAASNKPMQVSDRTNATWRVASNRGLRPSKKNLRLRRGIIIWSMGKCEKPSAWTGLQYCADCVGWRRVQLARTVKAILPWRRTAIPAEGAIIQISSFIKEFGEKNSFLLVMPNIM